MRLIGIFWGAIDPYLNEAKQYICQYGRILECYHIAFGNEFPKFLFELYSDETFGEEMKASQKIMSLVNRYKNDAYILLLDIPKTEKVFFPQKCKMMYINVLEAKVSIREKYAFLLNTPIGIDKKFENIFHLSDDEEEFVHDFPIILKYLLRYSKKTGFRIDNFVDESQIALEKNGTKRSVWLTKNLMFKPEDNGSFESYSELYNMYYMNLLNVYVADYSFVNYHGSNGVLTKKASGDEEILVTLTDIMKENNILEKKEMIRNNYIENLIELMEQYCKKNKFHLSNTTSIDLLRLYIYDLIFCQNDRNPSNLALIISLKTGFAKLICYDNSNMLFCDNIEMINQYKNKTLSIMEYINQHSKTFLLYDKDEFDICFASKQEHIKYFLKKADTSIRKFFVDFLKQYNRNNIEYILHRMENENAITIDPYFRHMVTDIHDIMKAYLSENEYEIFGDSSDL